VHPTRAFAFLPDALVQGAMCVWALISLHTFAVLDAENAGENQIENISLKVLIKDYKKDAYIFYDFDIRRLINQNCFLAL
jgi:hypothetical protein